MPELRVALAQTDPTVGAIEANTSHMLQCAREAAEQGAHVVAFGAYAVTGAPIADLARRASFLEAAQAGVVKLAQNLNDVGLGDLPVLLATPIAADDGAQTAIHVLRGGSAETLGLIPLIADPGATAPQGAETSTGTAAGASGHTFQVDVAGHTIDLAVGPHLPPGPAGDAREAVDLMLILDVHPYLENGPAQRVTALAALAREYGQPVAQVNLAGAQDDTVFSGGSALLGGDGNLLARAPLFEDHLLVLDVPSAESTSTHGHAITRELDPDAEVYSAVVTGLRSYIRKNGFRSVVLGMSGGIDSALLAALAADAIGGENVVGVSMPSAYSSGHSRDDAKDLAERLGAHMLTHPIAGMVDVFNEALDLEGVAAENLQARIRGLILMGLSNAHGHLVLAPGNKSELAVGYSTIYGDAVGGYAPLKDLVKTRVFALARWRNNEAIDAGEIPPIPENSITKPPSAELRPGQVDSDSLPPYDILDAILQAHIESFQGRAELVEAGFDADVVDKVLTMVDRAEWKRQQFAVGPQITPVAFGARRHMPVTNAWHE